MYNINMKWEDIFNELADAFKAPETKEEAIAYIKRDPGCLSVVEEMAFRQVIINILVAANIISEKDFNDSVEHFKKLFIDKFADELLLKVKSAKAQLELVEDDEDDIDDWPTDDKKIYQA